MMDSKICLTGFSKVAAQLNLFICLVSLGAIAGCSESSTKDDSAAAAGSSVRLSKNPDGGIEGVTFSGPDAADSDVKVIADYPDLKSVTFMECPAVTDAAMESLNSSTGLTSLVISNANIGDPGLKSLSAECVTSLTSVILSNLPATDKGMSCLAAMSNCDDVELFGLKISDEGLEVLSNLGALRRLSLRQCENVDGTGLSHLTKLAELRELDLRGTVLTEAGMRELGRLTQLEGIILDEENTTDAGLSEIAKISGLRILSFDDVRVTDDGLAHLASLPHLEELSISQCQITDNGLVHLAKLKTLRRLSINECHKISGEGMAHLESMTGLEMLSVNDSPVPEEAAMKLKEAIPECTIYYGYAPLIKVL